MPKPFELKRLKLQRYSSFFLIRPSLFDLAAGAKPSLGSDKTVQRIEKSMTKRNAIISGTYPVSQEK
jgi:hypothetical protein